MDACALDIETTGLGPQDRITCVAIAGEGWSWIWTLKQDADRDNYKEHIQYQLDAASTIYAFNGATFDIPVLQREFNFTNQDVGRWMLKLVDPLYAARALLGFDACAKLSDILRLNGVEPKTSTGQQAIVMAREGRWEELASYCENDTRVTFELLSKDCIYWTHNLQFRPKSKGVWGCRGLSVDSR